VDIPNFARRFPLTGAVVAITDIATPFGGAIARRLAAEVVPLAFATPDPEASCDALAEVRRVRELNRICDDPLTLTVDATTEYGMADFVRKTVSTYGSLDTVVLVAWAGQVPQGGQALTQLLAPLRAAVSGLARQGGGRLIVAADLGHDEAAPPSAYQACDAAVESIVGAAARAFASEDICVNGVVVHPADSGTGRQLALAAGLEAAPRSEPDLAAAASLIGLVAASVGLTGQVFRFGPAPARGQLELTGLLGAAVPT
jgi:NAD(P)-dependent dehydrogenase (short-subunit alcohol dehydrogenase family)